MCAYYVPTTLFVLPSVSLELKILANPKSEILGFISWSKRMLLALRSLCTTRSRECLCRYRRPCATPSIMARRLYQLSKLLWLSSTNHKQIRNQVDSDKYDLKYWALQFFYVQIELVCIPKIKKSRLLFGKYSYTKIFSSPWMQHPKSRTKFVCCSLAISSTSFLNSVKPCPECEASLLTAISWPSDNCPWKYVKKSLCMAWQVWFVDIQATKSLSEPLQ